MVEIADLFACTYALNGRGPKEYDCFGLFSELCRRRGITVPPIPTPTDLAACELEIFSNAAPLGWRKLEGPEPWCAVLLCITPPFVSHLGTMLEDCERFIHIRQGANVCVESVHSHRWHKRIAGYYSHE